MKSGLIYSPYIPVISSVSLWSGQVQSVESIDKGIKLRTPDFIDFDPTNLQRRGFTDKQILDRLHEYQGFLYNKDKRRVGSVGLKILSKGKFRVNVALWYEDANTLNFFTTELREELFNDEKYEALFLVYKPGRKNRR